MSEHSRLGWSDPFELHMMHPTLLPEPVVKSATGTRSSARSARSGGFGRLVSTGNTEPLTWFYLPLSFPFSLIGKIPFEGKVWSVIFFRILDSHFQVNRCGFSGFGTPFSEGSPRLAGFHLQKSVFWFEVFFHGDLVSVLTVIKFQRSMSNSSPKSGNGICCSISCTYPHLGFKRTKEILCERCSCYHDFRTLGER